MTKNSGDWEGLQGHDDHPAQFKHKAWVHEGGVAYIYIYIYLFYIYLYLYLYLYFFITKFLGFGVLGFGVWV